MNVLIEDDKVYIRGKHVFTAPGVVAESVILEDGIVLVYTVSGEMTPFDILKNVIKIDLSGKELWQIEAGAEKGPVQGYRHLRLAKDGLSWIITYGSGKYDYYLDMQTGRTHLVKD